MRPAQQQQKRGIDMWIFLNNAFLSIVANPEGGKMLVVRARANGDIERVFPGVRTYQTKGRDYMYRAFLPRKAVADALAKQALGITATNFKNSVKENDRHDAYMGVWGRMNRFQGARHYVAPATRQQALFAAATTADDDFDDGDSFPVCGVCGGSGHRNDQGYRTKCECCWGSGYKVL
jgi:hypothetical protein